MHKSRGSSGFFLQAGLLAVFMPQVVSLWAGIDGFAPKRACAETSAESSSTEIISTATGLPNVVVILVDDMGYGDAKCYNPESKVDTPNINALAAEGMRFTDAHAPGPLCHMSRYGLMTGRYPFRTNVNLWPQRPLIDQGQLTVASLLQSAGYRTSMVGKWHLGFAEDGYENPLPGGPVDVGFDEFFGIRASTDIPPYFYIRGDQAVQPPTNQITANRTEGWSPIQGEFWRAGGIAPNLQLADVLPKFADEAVQVLDRHANLRDPATPLFLYLALPAPHTPWLPSPEFQDASGAGMYGDFLMMVDSMIGRVIDRISHHDMDNNTLIIFTSDNGPVWYDNDAHRFDHDSCGELRGMKGDAWEAGHRMPFIVRWPGHVTPGSVSDQLVCFTDLVATVADIADAQDESLESLDSVSFLPALLDKEASPGSLRQHMVTTSGGGALAVRDGNWKWINRLGSSGFSQPKKVKPTAGGPTSQLYDLANDPSESNNLALQEQPRVARMRELLESIKTTKAIKQLPNP